MSTPFDLATVEAPFFEPLHGQKFSARAVDAPARPSIDLELIHVQPLNHWPGSPGRAPFSLLFKPVDPAAPMAQGTYECDAPGLTREPIFLVPVRDPLRGLCLEAVFH